VIASKILRPRAEEAAEGTLKTLENYFVENR
jgi:hypothetical protein